MTGSWDDTRGHQRSKIDIIILLNKTLIIQIFGQKSKFF